MKMIGVNLILFRHAKWSIDKKRDKLRTKKWRKEKRKIKTRKKELTNTSEAKRIKKYQKSSIQIKCYFSKRKKRVKKNQKLKASRRKSRKRMLPNNNQKPQNRVRKVRNKKFKKDRISKTHKMIKKQLIII